MRYLGIAVLFVLGPGLARAQKHPHLALSQNPYPRANEVSSQLKDADYALRRFQEVTGEINFGRWIAPSDLIDAKEKELASVLEDTRYARSQIDAVQAGKHISGLRLFGIYGALARAEATSVELEGNIDSYDSADANLAIELGKLYTLLVRTTENEFSVLVALQLNAEESELEACHPASK